MRISVSYKNCLIRSESIQLGRDGGWIPRYTLTLRDVHNRWNSTPSRYDRLDKVFWTETEADEFAFREAMARIDQD